MASDGSKEKITIVDLFAGLGGFHLGLSQVDEWNVECVFASELDPDLGRLYLKNFDHPEARFSNDVTDTRRVSKSTLEKMGAINAEILCAGFPCQPFSKAGQQKGLECERNGNLFELGVKRLIQIVNPRLLLLENVPNLERHDEGRTWKTIQKELSQIGYEVTHKILSPTQFGVPQVRRRMFIVGWKKGDPFGDYFDWPNVLQPRQVKKLTVRSVVDPSIHQRNTLPEHYNEALDLWSEFLDAIGPHAELPCPLWGMEFGATYNFETHSSQPGRCHFRNKKYGKVQGAFGSLLWSSGKEPESRQDFFLNIPSYAHGTKAFPEWKKKFIRQSREMYKRVQKDLPSQWVERIKNLPPSLQKLEWNCGDSVRDISEHMVQFRASGVRIKRASATPALVTMASQIPVLGKERRFLDTNEASKLQGMESINLADLKDSQAYKALGNAVCAQVVEAVGRQMNLARSSKFCANTQLELKLQASSQEGATQANKIST